MGWIVPTGIESRSGRYGVSRLVVFTAVGDLLGLFDQKCSYKHVSDFERLRIYGRLKLRKEV
jgi:hypothetical protein